MRFSPRSRNGAVTTRRAVSRRAIAILALVAAICSLFTAGFFVLAHSTAASAGAQQSATKGTLTAAGTADLAHAPAASAGAAGQRHDKLNRSRLAQTKNSALASQGSNQPSGIGSSFDVQHPGALLSNFNGVGSLDSAVTNFGSEFEPPDQGLCVGNGFVVEPVNSAFTIYHTDGSVVTGPFNVNVLFNEGLTQFTSDPRCHYDKATNTWFAIILFISTKGGKGFAFTNHAHTDLAVNTSGDPTTPWTVYQIDATDNGGNGTPDHPGCPCFGDQPRLGIDGQNIYISTDEFSILGPAFNGTQIYAVSKADLVNHASTIHFVHFDNLSMAGNIAFGVQPALTFGSSDAEYFLNSLDPNGTTDNRLGVWALTNRDAVSQGGIPTLSSVVIGSETYGVPPNAVQQGSSSLIVTDDDRMQQAEFINGSLWGALTTVLTIPGDTTARTAAAWFKVHPHLSGNTIGGADLSAQGYVAVSGNYLYYPAIQADGNGNAAIVMTLSAATFFPSAVYSVLHSGEATFGPVRLAGAGTGPYDPNATRWGDYSWAVLDPSGAAFWFATEYMPPKASQTTDGLRNWGTRVFEVSAGE